MRRSSDDPTERLAAADVGSAPMIRPFSCRARPSAGGLRESAAESTLAGPHRIGRPGGRRTPHRENAPHHLLESRESVRRTEPRRIRGNGRLAHCFCRNTHSSCTSPARHSPATGALPSVLIEVTTGRWSTARSPRVIGAPRGLFPVPRLERSLRASPKAFAARRRQRPRPAVAMPDRRSHATCTDGQEDSPAKPSTARAV